MTPKRVQRMLQSQLLVGTHLILRMNKIKKGTSPIRPLMRMINPTKMVILAIMPMEGLTVVTTTKVKTELILILIQTLIRMATMLKVIKAKTVRILMLTLIQTVTMLKIKIILLLKNLLIKGQRLCRGLKISLMV